MENGKNPIMIRCSRCGAPAEFDILHQKYCCPYCGSKVSVTTILKEKNGWKAAKKLSSARSMAERKKCVYGCSGCGAKVIIPEGEALGKCSFCGGKVVRRAYAQSDLLPEIVIPFFIDREEAMECLESWCSKNEARAEAKMVQAHKSELCGYYLPYQMVKGSAEGDVCTSSSDRRYTWRTYLDEIAINTSRQIPNELLDAAEPFQWENVLEFDFGMLAGQRVKLQDINENELADRISSELTSDFQDTLKAKFRANGVEVKAKMDSLLILNAALPMYILDCGAVKMVINGQTGHVAVKKKKVRTLDLSLLEPILITILLFLVSFVGFYFFGGTDLQTSLKIGLGIMACFGIVTFCVFAERGGKAKKAADDILRTPPTAAVRKNDRLIITEISENKKKPKPMLVERLRSSGITPVDVRIYPVSRILKWVLVFFAMNFTPLVLALLVNGFQFAKLQPSNCIVWWCLSVPASFILYLKFVRSEAFENPYFYYLKDGKRGARVPCSEFDCEKKKATVKKESQRGKGGIDWSGLLIFLVIAGIFAVVLLIIVMMTAGIW